MPAERIRIGSRTPRAKPVVVEMGATAAAAPLAGSAWAQSSSGIAGVVAPGVVPPGVLPELVLDAAERYLRAVEVPRQPSNAGFAGPDKRVLYITAREGLYRINMLAQGSDHIGK